MYGVHVVATWHLLNELAVIIPFDLLFFIRKHGTRFLALLEETGTLFLKIQTENIL